MCQMVKNITRPLPRGQQTFFFLLIFRPRGLLGPWGAVLCGTLRTQKVVPHLGGVEKHQKLHEMGRECTKINITYLVKTARNFGANPAVTTGMRQDP